MSLKPRPSRTRALMASTALGGALLLAFALPAGVFAAGTVTHYALAPSPIAAGASLAANSTVMVTVSAEGSTNALVPGAIVYLSLSQTTGGGSASVGSKVLTATPVAFTVTTGQISVTYRTPAVLPPGGKDIIKAANAKSSASITASDSYSYSKVIRYDFLATPIAPPGTLASGATTSVTLTAFDATNVAVPGAVVYLSYAPTAGGGTASVGMTPLSSTLTAFTANPSGQVVITYHSPVTLPATGIDTITAADAAKNATITRSDGYSFAASGSYLFSPSPIAATGALAAGTTVLVHLTALDAGGHAVAGAVVWISFTPTAGGGSARVGSKTLSATPAKFLTGSTGTMTVTYKSSAAPPLTGTDTITVGNSKTAPTVVVTDGYTY